LTHGVGDADVPRTASGFSFGPAARSTCSFCTSGISPRRCFSQEQKTIKQAHAEKAMHFCIENRIKRRHSNRPPAGRARRKLILALVIVLVLEIPANNLREQEY